MQKELKIGESTYKIGLFNAADGSWVSSQFITRLLLVDPEKAKEESNLAFILAGSLSEFPETTFNSLRDKCLGACMKQNGDALLPLLMKDGRWGVPESERPDIVAVNVLMVATLVHNLLPFFAPGALDLLRQTYPVERLKQLLQAASTTTSSGQ
jgi:hypothetical protein